MSYLPQEEFSDDMYSLLYRGKYQGMDSDANPNNHNCNNLIATTIAMASRNL